VAIYSALYILYFFAFPYKNFAFLCLVSAKRQFVIKKTTFFESKNHLFSSKKGGFFTIESKSGRNQKPFGNDKIRSRFDDYIISNAVLNVVPDDWRAEILHDMAGRWKVGGK